MKSNDRPTRDSMPLEEATISNMWEIAAKRERGTRSRFLCSKPGRLSHSLPSKLRRLPFAKRFRYQARVTLKMGHK
jgi:hypothetical protein